MSNSADPDQLASSRSVGFFRSQLIWIYIVCKGRVYPGSAGQGFSQLFLNLNTIFTLNIWTDVPKQTEQIQIRSRRWFGGAKMSFILCHWGVQLIMAYSWARPAILVASKGRGGCFYFFCFFTFIPVPLSSLTLSLSFISSTISFLPFSGR